MTRGYQMIFEMINAGEFTPETALAEAKSLWYDQPSAELLVLWAWDKLDERYRTYKSAHAAEVRTAQAMLNSVTPL